MASKEVAKKSEESSPAPAESAFESLFAPLMELRQRMDKLIATIARAQAPDGYLATQNLVRNRPRFPGDNY